MNPQHRGDIERRLLAEKTLPDHRDNQRPDQKLRKFRQPRVSDFAARDAVFDQLAHSGDAVRDHLAVIEFRELRKARAFGNNHSHDVSAFCADDVAGERLGQCFHRRPRRSCTRPNRGFEIRTISGPSAVRTSS